MLTPLWAEASEWLERQVKTVDALRNGDAVMLRRRQLPTLFELVSEYTDQHSAEENTLRTLKERLRYATEGPRRNGQGGFGNLRIDRAKLLDENPATLVPNPEPRRKEVPAFGSLEEVEAVGAELSPALQALPAFTALTGFARRSGLRSNGATLIAAGESFTFAVCSRMGR